MQDMSTDTTIWKSPNNIWYADKTNKRSGWIRNEKTGASYSWIQYDDGKMAYDLPYQIPRYVKDGLQNALLPSVKISSKKYPNTTLTYRADRAPK